MVVHRNLSNGPRNGANLVRSSPFNRKHSSLTIRTLLPLRSSHVQFIRRITCTVDDALCVKSGGDRVSVTRSVLHDIGIVIKRYTGIEHTSHHPDTTHEVRGGLVTRFGPQAIRPKFQTMKLIAPEFKLFFIIPFGLVSPSYKRTRMSLVESWPRTGSVRA